MKNTLSKKLFSIGIAFILLTSMQNYGQQKQDKKVITWQDKLYEESINYGSFACKNDDKTIVDDYFKDKPLNRILSVCHNNCAVLTEFPKRDLPPFDKKIIGTGFIAVHVLTNEHGEPIFARAVNGHILMRSVFQTRTCEAKFRTWSTKRQTVLFLCPNDKCDSAQPVEQN